MINPEFYFEMNDKANKLRHEWFIDENVPIDIFSIVKNKIDNLTVVFMDMGEEISGASSSFDEQNIIFINSLQSYGRQRFNLAHEVYHLKYDEKFITCLKGSNIDIERKADEFASCLLLPHNALKYYEELNDIKEKKDWTIEKIIDAEQYFQISHHAILWRLRNLEILTYEQYQKFKKHPSEKARKMGYNTKLYEPYTDENTTDGNYINLLNKLYDKKIISIEEKNEYLLDAFCE
ncbi:ImmA/IrrE family metallo-endopeptidase [Methanosphaera sp.]|uniref:ImmA/IrrE family metallo-endopeptidase n=1 Tax=Methanosphaera sp. TaxID=2666342 RepID=UPI0026DF33E7|nr:ImmA/IrrE family metallo-endopeptidase [Methanosphaera sp.]MDO5821756.1 ImmA/IrrE family metallo-endopeptidase [Methanosphaera sp.]